MNHRDSFSRSFAGVLAFVALIAALSCRASHSTAEETAPDLATHLLCAEASDPDGPHDKIFINCNLDTGDFTPDATLVFDGSITVAAYNIERGFSVDKQIKLFLKHPVMKETDVLLISEADRGCPRTNYRNIAREFAAALGMSYAYGVEFVELPRGENWSRPCEHGNAILSRYPMKNVRAIRHAKTGKWYIEPEERHKGGEPRLGGRMAMTAEIVFGDTPVRFYSVHFESGLNDNDVRSAEALELVEDARNFDGPVVIGGDMNTYRYIRELQGGDAEPVAGVFKAGGFFDAHADVPLKKRGTTRVEYAMRVIIDLLFVQGLTVQKSGRCPGRICDPLSDHLPIWTILKPPE